MSLDLLSSGSKWSGFHLVKQLFVFLKNFLSAVCLESLALIISSSEKKGRGSKLATGELREGLLGNDELCLLLN